MSKNFQNTHSKYWVSTITTASVLACSSLGLNSLAQAQMIEEVVVSAQKREQNLQEVGISISAFGEDAIQKLGLETVEGLAAAVPNLQALDAAAGLPSFRIRGQGLNEFQASFDSPVGVHIDEVFQSKPFLISLGQFDVERVEVLKGPQGTVFGRNTTGGAVNFYSNKPTEEFEAGINASYGSYSRFESEGYVSGPIADALLGRLALQFHNYDNDGPYFNQFTNDELGQKEQYQLRGQLSWSNNETSVLFSTEYGYKNADLTPYDNLFQDMPGGAQAGGTTDPLKTDIRNPISRYTVNQDYFPTSENTTASLLLRIEHELALGTITSLSSYKTFERDNREDSDNTPVRSVNIDWYSNIDQVTQELRFAGETDTWNYLVGAYYERDELETVQTFDVTAGLGVFLGSDDITKTSSWAIFTSHEWAFSDQLSLIFGARYTEENNNIVGEAFAAGSTAIPQGIQNRISSADRLGALVVNTNRTDNDLNAKIGLNFAPADDMLIYGSVSTGFRSGGYDLAAGAATLESFDPEDVTAYELGFKMSALESRLQFNSALFYTEVEDYQTNVNFGAELVPRRRNIGQLDTFGAEVDTLWQPNDLWRIQIALGYTDSEISKVNNDPNGDPFAIDGVSLKGNQAVNTPELSAGAIVGYTQPLGGELGLEFLANYSWTDERYLEIQNSNDHLVDSYSTLDLSITLLSEDKGWSVSAWGKNVTDEDYLRYINDVPAFGLFLTINAEPESYGIKIDYDFH